MIPKGTRPNAREWVQCSLPDFRQALNSMRRNKILLTQATLCNQDIFRDKDEQVLARRYRYLKSEQCLIHTSMRKHIPENRVINNEGSIYEGISHVKLF